MTARLRIECSTAELLWRYRAHVSNRRSIHRNSFYLMPSRQNALQKGRWRFDDHAMKRRQRQEMLAVSSDEHVAATDERHFEYTAVLDMLDVRPMAVRHVLGRCAADIVKKDVNFRLGQSQFPARIASDLRQNVRSRHIQELACKQAINDPRWRSAKCERGYQNIGIDACHESARRFDRSIGTLLIQQTGRRSPPR